MRKFLIPLAAAASTLAIASPATAQWYPPPPQGHAYGYANNYGQVRAVQARINHIQREIARLAQYRMISRGEYLRLRSDSRDIERRFYRNARDGRGLTGREMYDVQVRIARLEQKIARDVRDGRRWRHRW